jgi:hypothetical protein
VTSVQLYDTTLRDGAQKEGISFSVVDKLDIAHKLDELGVHFISLQTVLAGFGSQYREVSFYLVLGYLSPVLVPLNPPVLNERLENMFTKSFTY